MMEIKLTRVDCQVDSVPDLVTCVPPKQDKVISLLSLFCDRVQVGFEPRKMQNK
jgi:hypothetical protein